MTYPTITPLPTAPSRSQAPDAFASTADAFVAALPDLVTDVNAAGAFIDSKSIAVGNEFQGPYSAGTTYTTGQSVSYSSKFYISLVGGNTGNTPDSSPSEWQEIPTSEIPDQSGNSGLFLTTDGTDLSWGAAGGGMKSMQVFTSNGTWTKPAGITLVRIRVAGGGGGGGGFHDSNNTNGGGGGAGGYAEEIIDVSGVSTVTVTVGGGGAGGGNRTAGTAGGTSSFGAYVSATGGAGGSTFSANNNMASGGLGSGGDLNLSGGHGFPSYTSSENPKTTGAGGSSYFGGGTPYTFDNSNYPALTLPPSVGGAGGQITNNTGTSGKAGIVIVEEYA